MDVKNSILVLDDNDDCYKSFVSSIVSSDASTADDDASSIDFCTRFDGEPLLSEIPIPSKLSCLNDAMCAKGFPPGLAQHSSNAQGKDKQAPKLISLFNGLEPNETNHNFSFQPCDDLDTASQDTFKEAFLLALTAKRAGRSMQRQCHKTQLCRFYARGQCYLGNECLYAHTRDELQAAPSLKKTRLCQNFLRQQCLKKDCNFAHGYKELRSTDVFYKTTFCRWFARNACKAGEHCRYAHSIAELRDDGPA
eukprot:TRINITY_DN1461_c0_g3_i1.p1 TRINITY_DN1461_c0_g3~~TRINITY_DN1461_c0_g3_i1.p1  ORF type:complete len:251 (+),score=32.41 TRINITY_DN1461_c0_g3_i1:89-841(+)